MDDRIKNMLRAAWTENRLIALHIDAQVYYEKSATYEAFLGVRKCARVMREHGIPNQWVSYIEKDEEPTLTTVGEFNRRSRAQNRATACISEIAGADDGEALLCKYDTNGFHNTGLDAHLKERRKDTLLIDGVYAMHCVSLTARTALRRDYNVVVNMDGIDYRFGDSKILRQRIQGHYVYTETMNTRFGTATIEDLACIF